MARAEPGRRWKFGVAKWKLCIKQSHLITSWNLIIDTPSSMLCATLGHGERVLHGESWWKPKRKHKLSPFHSWACERSTQYANLIGIELIHLHLQKLGRISDPDEDAYFNEFLNLAQIPQLHFHFRSSQIRVFVYWTHEARDWWAAADSSLNEFWAKPNLFGLFLVRVCG